MAACLCSTRKLSLDFSPLSIFHVSCFETSVHLMEFVLQILTVLIERNLKLDHIPFTSHLSVMKYFVIKVVLYVVMLFWL